MHTHCHVLNLRTDTNTGGRPSRRILILLILDVVWADTGLIGAGHIDMTNNRLTREHELLVELCLKHGVKIELIEELLKVEKDFQLRDRRHGIYERLKETIQASISPHEQMD